MNSLEEYELSCFPRLKSSMKLDGLTFESLLNQLSSQKSVYSLKVKQGWFECFSYAGLLLNVLLHSESKQFDFKRVIGWTYHPKAKDFEPDFYIWLVDKKERTTRV